MSGLVLEIAGPIVAVATIVGFAAWDRYDKRHPQFEEITWRLAKQFRAITVAIGEVLMPTMQRLAKAFAELAEALRDDGAL